MDHTAGQHRNEIIIALDTRSLTPVANQDARDALPFFSVLLLSYS